MRSTLPGQAVDISDELGPVLENFGTVVAAARWAALGAAGGFSGSRIWRGVSADGHEFALKAYPFDMDRERLAQVHRWMCVAQEAGLDFVPAVEHCRNGDSVAFVGNRCWDVMAWMPGRADFQDDPTNSRLFAATQAIARIHSVWSKQFVREGTCPAILRRWRALLGWEELVAKGWRPRFTREDRLSPIAESAWNLTLPVVPTLRLQLLPWLDRPVPLQPCIGDIWHDHILFDEDRVTGLIDYGAAKVDHVTADLARLFGSLVPDDHQRMVAAIRAYERIRPLPHQELAFLLDRTGLVASVVNWLRRIYFDRDSTIDRAAVASRLARLVARLA